MYQELRHIKSPQEDTAIPKPRNIPADLAPEEDENVEEKREETNEDLLIAFRANPTIHYMDKIVHKKDQQLVLNTGCWRQERTKFRSKPKKYLLEVHAPEIFEAHIFHEHFSAISISSTLAFSAMDLLAG
ncbi:hypothetical protein AXG93_2815s1010 [Marchantia polymorpha subsp. ruderalis]|uniref:Uncharacterized protein n=1 Tax=Marchantia polymorpha subsp. ruderalis TaxID=1480154 RepID=A0A176WEH6_MARPO|nr:hypothetical protein AXG93_2815s1010 [Marchantia polymorpha subsp. ruderalis]